jgi:tetratricopeptide (TPR) repeat protein
VTAARGADIILPMRTLAFGLAILIANTVFAQQPQQRRVPPRAQPAATPAAPAADAPGADEYTQRVQRGIERLLAGDNSGATGAFREAIAMDAARPIAPYYLAAAQRVAGNLQDALTGFQSAVQLARTANDGRWTARCLQGVAETLERIEGRTEDARTAWQEYVRFADSNQPVSDPAMGRARVQAIDVMMEQERAYVQVRTRIAEREQERAREQQQGQQRPRRGR